MMTPRSAVYVGFSYGTAWYSRVIRWLTGNGPSHAFLLFWDQQFCSWVQLGSEAGGWMLLPAAEIEGETRNLYALPGLDLWAGLRAHADMLGCGYDFAGLLGMAPVIVLWRWLKLRVRNPLQSSKRWFCSEAVAQILRWNGAEITFEPGDTDPKRLEAEVAALGGVPLTWKEIVG